MTTPVEVTDGIIDNFKYAYRTVKINFDHVFRLLRPIFIPLLIVTIIPEFFSDDDPMKATPIEIALMIIFFVPQTIVSSAFAIAWHRFIILGPSEDNHVRLSNIKHSEWHFIFCTICISVFIGVPAGLLASGLNTIDWILLFVLFCAAFYWLIRASLYLPATAVESDITLKQTLALSKGLVTKILLCSLLICIPAAVAMLVVIFVLAVIAGVLATVFPAVAQIITALILTPPLLFCTMVCAALAITALSRYYLWAVRNRGAPE